MKRGQGKGSAPEFGHGGGLRRVWRAWLATRAGLAAAFRSQAAFRQEVALAALAMPFVVLADVGAAERALLFSSVVAVLVVELLNTAIEQTLDRVSTEIHPLAKAAKDAGSAAVFLALVAAAVVWLLVLVLPALGF
ncbi:diacylglycerol kinase [Oricola thermophila]|uniref:Diacylglycerol kinase n=1 Tax=Oricola thermophila TaxID=2742145 RepID=A0A6N1VF58_9HYPH|nr:diacylglycerol kinase [Oricola thermophila]QKV19474.1 diacylglycerol kinase [Oricola thermophila]